jgi:hypothetical protein
LQLSFVIFTARNLLSTDSTYIAWITFKKKFGVVGLHLSEGSSSGQCDETEEGPAFYATGDDKENLPPETHNDVAATVLHDNWPLTGAVFPSKLLCF